MESIGSSLGFEEEFIWAGLDWRGPDISSGLVNRHLIIIEGHGRSRKVMDGLFTSLTFQVRKVIGGGVVVGWWVCGL